MGDMLLAFTMLVYFAFGYFVIERVGEFVDGNSLACQNPQIPGRKVYITGTEGKSAGTISEEISAVLNSLPDRNEYKIMIFKTADAGIVEYLKQSGCAIAYYPRQ